MVDADNVRYFGDVFSETKKEEAIRERATKIGTANRECDLHGKC